MAFQNSQNFACGAGKGRILAQGSSNKAYKILEIFAASLIRRSQSIKYPSLKSSDIHLYQPKSQDQPGANFKGPSDISISNVIPLILKYPEMGISRIQAQRNFVYRLGRAQEKPQEKIRKTPKKSQEKSWIIHSRALKNKRGLEQNFK